MDASPTDIEMDDKECSEDLNNFKKCLHRINNIADKKDFVKYIEGLADFKTSIYSSLESYMKNIFENATFIENNFHLIHNIPLEAISEIIERILEHMNKLFDLYSKKIKVDSGSSVIYAVQDARRALNEILKIKPHSGMIITGIFIYNYYEFFRI